MEDTYKKIKSLLRTEKGTQMLPYNKYLFRVSGDANKISIKNNTFLGLGGVEIFDSIEISLINNSFHIEGIILNGDLKEHWNTHTILQNFIGDSPIEYYSNTHNISASENAIQVILGNATNIKIYGLQLAVRAIVAKYIRFAKKLLRNPALMESIENIG